jgi:hypothetical protein
MKNVVKTVEGKILAEKIYHESGIIDRYVSIKYIEHKV